MANSKNAGAKPGNQNAKKAPDQLSKKTAQIHLMCEPDIKNALVQLAKNQGVKLNDLCMPVLIEHFKLK